MNDSELMTVNEVAALFGVTRRTIFRWMNKIKAGPSRSVRLAKELSLSDLRFWNSIKTKALATNENSY